MSSTIENRARRIAKSVNLIARKSRRYDPLNNHGEFMLIEPSGIIPLPDFSTT